MTRDKYFAYQTKMLCTGSASCYIMDHYGFYYLFIFLITLWFIVTSGFLPGSKPKNVNAPVRRMNYPGNVMYKAQLCVPGLQGCCCSSYHQYWCYTVVTVDFFINTLFAVEVIAGINIMTAIIIVYLFHHFKWGKWEMLRIKKF